MNKDFTSALKAEITKQASSSQAFQGEGLDTISGFNTALSQSNEGEIKEKWSNKYKKSIDCKNPKGFSQKAHCQGKKKKSENKEATGAASAGSFEAPLFSSIKKKIKEELEKKVKKKEETKEATGAVSAGSYVTPKVWAKSTSKKDWRGKSKTQIPGGKFVTVKKKCKTFPYCNQGDINALKIYENKVVKNIIEKISKEQNISENVIKVIIQYEIEKFKNNSKK